MSKFKFLTTLIFLLTLTASFTVIKPDKANAQAKYKEFSDSLIVGDTVSSFQLGAIYDNGIVTGRDSSNSTTDSMKAYVETAVGSGVWILYGLKNIQTGSIETVLVPGDGAAKGWAFPDMVPPSIKFVLANAQYSTLRKINLVLQMRRTPF